jgi:aspartate aminotransferase
VYICLSINVFLAMQLAHRLNTINEPQTIKMAKLSRELKNAGINVIDLSLGEPDFATPEFICDAAVAAIHDGYTKYPPVAGYPELLEAISKKLLRDNNLEYAPNEILVSTGAKQSLANAILCLVNPGDDVLIPTPYWVTYSSLVQFAGGNPVYIDCHIDSDFKLTPALLQQHITEKTTLLIYSSPCNPSGSVYSRDELAALADVLELYPNISIISDEIYEYINFVGKHESIASFSKLRDRVAIINGFSKGFAMTGWRLGYMAAPRSLVQACEKLQAQFTSGANSVTQRAAITAMNGNLEPTLHMKQAFRERRDYVISELGKIPGVKINLPEGAFYAFPDVSSFFGKSDGSITVNNDDDFSMYLLNKAHVATVCGSAFGNANCIRMSYATSIDLITEALTRMKVALAALK